MEAYSQDLRDRVLRALERGERPVDIAQRLEAAEFGSIRSKAASRPVASGAADRSAATAFPAWPRLNRRCGRGSKSSRI